MRFRLICICLFILTLLFVSLSNAEDRSGLTGLSWTKMNLDARLIFTMGYLAADSHGLSSDDITDIVLAMNSLTDDPQNLSSSISDLMKAAIRAASTASHNNMPATDSHPATSGQRRDAQLAYINAQLDQCHNELAALDAKQASRRVIVPTGGGTRTANGYSADGTPVSVSYAVPDNQTISMAGSINPSDKGRRRQLTQQIEQLEEERKLILSLTP